MKTKLTEKEVLELRYKAEGTIFKKGELEKALTRLNELGYKSFRKSIKRNEKGEIEVSYNECTINQHYLSSNFNVMQPSGTGIFFKKENFKEIYFGLDAKLNGESYIIITNPDKLELTNKKS